MPESPPFASSRPPISNFFNKESGLFNSENHNSSNTTVNDFSSNLLDQEAPASDLDIVGALGTLNLDEDFDRLPKPHPDLKQQLQPFQQPLVPNVVTGPQVLPGISSMGSLTPNPPLGSTFVAQGTNPRHPSTISTPAPSAPWSNTFVPFSAPPFAFPMSDPNTELAMLVLPLELPDSKPTATPNPLMPASPQLMHPFGGMLDSRFAFGNFYVPGFDSTNSNNDKNEPDKSKADTSRANEKSALPVEMPEFLPSQQSMGIPSMWNQPHPSFINPQFMPNRPHDTEGSAMSDPLTPYGNSQPTFGRPDMQPRFGNVTSQNGFMDSNARGNSPQAGNNLSGDHGGGYNHRRQPFMNSGVNVHRKMHNSHRRKGEDASKYANAKLEDFSGSIWNLCKDQHGCRFLQRQLDLGKEAANKMNATEKDVLTNDVAATMIFNEIYLRVVDLMVDPFGNYLIQKLLENVSTDQRLVMVKNAAPDFIKIALDPHGTRALQKLVECISSAEETQLIVDNLSPHIVTLSRDLNGNHVVQKCLQKFSPKNNQFIFDTASAFCNEIATHRHGCCVLQRCLDYGNEAQRQQLSWKVADNATNLSLDPFGNYVVQYVLSRGDEKSINIILEHIKPNIILLSLHKFGSNVVEKSLRIPTLTDEVMKVLLENSEDFGLLINDPFGNYVLQTSLDVAKSDNLAKLAVGLQPLLPSIKNTPHGRRIITKIQNVL